MSEQASTTGLAGANVNSELPQISYFVSTDDEGNVDGLYRVVKDDSAQTLDMQNLTEDGWVDDPSLIDQLKEPGVVQVTDEQELMDIRKALYFDNDPDQDGDDDSAGSQQDPDGDAPPASAQQ